MRALARRRLFLNIRAVKPVVMPPGFPTDISVCDPQRLLLQLRCRLIVLFDKPGLSA